MIRRYLNYDVNYNQREEPLIVSLSSLKVYIVVIYYDFHRDVHLVIKKQLEQREKTLAK